MRYLLLLLLALLPLNAFAVLGQDDRFDFTNGQPAVVVDSSTACNDTENVRFDFTNGEPTVVYDPSANCTAVAGESTVQDDIIWFN